MDNRPIGVFDSGLGGLTAVKELEKLLPCESIVYFGDTGRVPYGTRSCETITKYAFQALNFLKSKNVKAVLAACGTVSSVVKGLGDGLGILYSNVLKPTSQAAVKKTKNDRIGVIGTSATINSGSYKAELLTLDPQVSVFEEACPMFVPLVENGFIEKGNEVTKLVARGYLEKIKAVNVDTLILGCTHFPIISGVISEVMGDSVTLIDSGREAALYLAGQLESHKLLAEAHAPVSRSFFVSDTTLGFSNIAEIFLGHEVTGDVRRIDIEKY